MTGITLTYLEKIQEERKDNLRVYQQKWKEHNKEEAADEKIRGINIFSFSRKCELCGSVGFVNKRIPGLRRKMKYNKQKNRYECQNKVTCEERIEKFIDGRWTLTDEDWR